MKTTLLFFATIISICGFTQMEVIPRPAVIKSAEGSFSVNDQTVIAYSGQCSAEASMLSEWMQEYSGEKIEVINELPEDKKNCIVLKCNDRGTQGHPLPDLPGDLEARIANKPKGSYQLSILKDRILLNADDATGIFYGISTLNQLRLLRQSQPPALHQPAFPCMNIRDEPAFAHRGLLLDCCRHFMSKEFILKYIDLLALYKMNVLHWHLTEDQGWRIQIDQYPLLTEVGAWRREADGSLYGGFYTKADIREIVAYAAARHVTIIPEIEMPGHSLAAIAAYPSLGCTGNKVEVENDWGVFKDIYCAGNEETFLFLTNVLNEVCELFPSPYIHIGGDEAPKFRWERCGKCQNRMKEQALSNEAELQTYFIERIAEFLSSKGKKIIGWDEILEGGIPADAAVQSWRGMDGGKQAAMEGHDVIMSPTSHCYFDYGLESTDLKEVYGFDPVPAGLSAAGRLKIKGAECNMWTEHAPQELVDSKVFPRLLAMSEVLWSYPSDRNYDEFSQRVNAHYDLLDMLDVNYGFPSIPVEVLQQSDPSGVISVAAKPAFAGVSIETALIPFQDFSVRIDSVQFSATDSFLIRSPSQLLVKTSFRGRAYPAVISRYYHPHLAMGREVKLAETPSPYYPAGGNNALADGNLGGGSFRDGFWQGLSGKDMIATLDIGMVKDVSQISSRFFHYGNAWIFRPRQVQFECSTDAINWKSLGVITPQEDEKLPGEFIVPVVLKFPSEKVRYVRMTAANFGPCPVWHDAPGEPSWLFCDEIVIK
jgi:hexosaminidase